MGISRGLMRVLVLGVVMFAASPEKPATAGVIYDFALPANGAVGPVDIKISFPDFVPGNGQLDVIPLSDPSISYTSGTALNPSVSVVGLTVTPSFTLFGVDLITPSGATALLTFSYPADFFVFLRSPSQTGVTSSIAGDVVSSFSLATPFPTATLSVSVPEPASLVLASLGFAIGLGVLSRRRKAPTL